MEGYLKDKQGYPIVDGSGKPVPEELRDSVFGYEGQSPSRRTPLAHRPITGANPGFWNDIKAWWTELKPEYRYGIFGGLAAIGVIVAACQKGGAEAGLRKV